MWLIKEEWLMLMPSIFGETLFDDLFDNFGRVCRLSLEYQSDSLDAGHESGHCITRHDTTKSPAECYQGWIEVQKVNYYAEAISGNDTEYDKRQANNNT